MLYINKRIISIIIICFLLFVLTFLKYKKQKILETVALPIQNKVIVLDAGHGLPDNRCFK